MSSEEDDCGGCGRTFKGVTDQFHAVPFRFATPSESPSLDSKTLPAPIDIYKKRLLLMSSGPKAVSIKNIKKRKQIPTRDLKKRPSRSTTYYKKNLKSKNCVLRKVQESNIFRPISTSDCRNDDSILISYLTSENPKPSNFSARSSCPIEMPFAELGAELGNDSSNVNLKHTKALRPMAHDVERVQFTFVDVEECKSKDMHLEVDSKLNSISLLKSPIKLETQSVAPFIENLNIEGASIDESDDCMKNGIEIKKESSPEFPGHPIIKFESSIGETIEDVEIFDSFRLPKKEIQITEMETVATSRKCNKLSSGYFRCSYCIYKTRRKSTLKTHIQVLHFGLKPFECQLCEFKTKKNWLLKHHVNSIHLKLKPFACPECDYKTAERRDLKGHIESKHLKLKKFQCTECPYKANLLIGLKQHINAVHIDLKPFKCQQCDFKSNYKSHLKTHIDAAHSNLKPFECSECEYRASLKSLLKVHIDTVHLKIKKIKKFACSMCYYRTTASSRLREHINSVHSRSTSFKCSKCNFETSVKCNLKAHVDSVHLKLKPFECSECDYKGSTKFSIKSHINRIHSNRPIKIKKKRLVVHKLC